jgi:hypothetical protein
MSYYDINRNTDFLRIVVSFGFDYGINPVSFVCHQHEGLLPELSRCGSRRGRYDNKEFDHDYKAFATALFSNYFAAKREDAKITITAERLKWSEKHNWVIGTPMPEVDSLDKVVDILTSRA